MQVKIWFQNRRTKWKKSENITNAEAAEHRVNHGRTPERGESPINNQERNKTDDDLKGEDCMKLSDLTQAMPQPAELNNGDKSCLLTHEDPPQFKRSPEHPNEDIKGTGAKTASDESREGVPEERLSDGDHSHSTGAKQLKVSIDSEKSRSRDADDVVKVLEEFTSDAVQS